MDRIYWRGRGTEPRPRMYWKIRLECEADSEQELVHVVVVAVDVESCKIAALSIAERGIAIAQIGGNAVGEGIGAARPTFQAKLVSMLEPNLAESPRVVNTLPFVSTNPIPRPAPT